MPLTLKDRIFEGLKSQQETWDDVVAFVPPDLDLTQEVGYFEPLPAFYLWTSNGVYAAEYNPSANLNFIAALPRNPPIIKDK